MRNRQRRTIRTPDQNLDSFLDILTNTVGVLMFISLFVSLIASEADSIIKTPLVVAEEPGKERTPRFFEVRDNRVSHIDDEKVGDEIELVIGSLPNCNRPEFDSVGSADYVAGLNFYKSCITNRARRLTNFTTQTEFYDVEMVDARTFSFRYQPIPNKLGETVDEFEASESSYEEALKSFDPKDSYLAFIVRPNSFKAFRAAREKAWAMGFDVGWEPHKPEFPIQFGDAALNPGGRAIGAQ